jgi:hypothetical protein
LIVNAVATLVGQLIHAQALGYEDVNDRDDLRHDPVLGRLSETGNWPMPRQARSDCIS